MKTVKHFGILFALLLMVGLLAVGQTVMAYNEGDISGTTGIGTRADPIKVDSFSELREACALTRFGTHLYIELENKTVEETLPRDATSLTSAIGLNTGYVHLILNGSYVFKVNHISESLYGNLFEVRSGGTLEISGDGKICFSPMLTGAYNAVVLVNGGTVEINSGHLEGHPLNWRVFGRAIYYRWGELLIYNGTFTGYDDRDSPKIADALTIIPPNNISNNHVSIFGGSFSASSRVAPTDVKYGLSVSGDSTYNKYEIIKLAGGTFDGIEIDGCEAMIGDLLEDGYHTFYGSGAPALSIEQTAKTSGKIMIKRTISSVSVTLDAPAIGVKPDYTATFPNGVPYFSDAYNEGNYRNDIGWWSENMHNHVNPDSGVFQADYQYKVSVYLTAQDGYAFTNSTTATLNGQSAEASLENGQLLVQYTFPKLTAITRGDLNSDGSVNQKDLAMLSKYMRNSTLYPLNETAMAAADINGDGNVNQKDLAILSKYMRNPTAYPLP